MSIPRSSDIQAVPVTFGENGPRQSAENTRYESTNVASYESADNDAGTMQIINTVPTITQLVVTSINDNIEQELAFRGIRVNLKKLNEIVVSDCHKPVDPTELALQHKIQTSMCHTCLLYLDMNCINICFSEKLDKRTKQAMLYLVLSYLEYKKHDPVCAKQLGIRPDIVYLTGCPCDSHWDRHPCVTPKEAGFIFHSNKHGCPY